MQLPLAPEAGRQVATAPWNPTRVRRRQISMHDTRPVSRDRFRDLAAEIYEPVQRYVRRRVDPAAVDDVISETMITLWRRLDDVPAGAHLPWAYAVARRHVANHRRTLGRHLNLVRRLAAEPPAVSNEDGHLDPELEAAIGRLGETDRELLRLWAWEQLEPAEIAVVLGITPNAASIRLHRAKKQLAKKLEIARKNGTPSGHSHGESIEEARS